MKKKKKVEIQLEPMEKGGYFARILGLPGCMSEGKTEYEVLMNITEAMRLWLEVGLKDGVFDKDDIIKEKDCV